MKKIVLILTLGVVMACNDSQQNVKPEDVVSLWGVDSDFVMDGGVGKDGIISLDNPSFILQSEASFLNNDDLVLVLKVENEIRVYPHRILDYHEIVNTSINGNLITVSYCPLTGTGFAWPGMFEELNTEYGVSGLLYNNNLIMYDRQTDSYWSQMRLESIRGEKLGSQMTTIPMIETNWGTWKSMGYEESLVMAPPQGNSYHSYPYGTYRTNNDYILFPVAVSDNRIPAKERVLVMPNSDQEALAFRYHDMANRENLVNYENLTIIAFPEEDLMVGFSPTYADGSEATLIRVTNQFPIIMTDAEGNMWDVFGRAVSGPRQNEMLHRVTTTMAYFFCLSSVYDKLAIYGNYKPIENGG